MIDPASTSRATPPEFSLPLFALTVSTTLVALLAALRLFASHVWEIQLLAPFSHAVVAFLAISLINCFLEYLFHRYVLHTPAVPYLRRLYRQHTLHHALTHIGREQRHDGRAILVIDNKFPIIEPEQHDAAFFPWYSMAVFAVVLSPLLTLLQWLFPSFPWFFAGFAALAVSLSLYEILHAVNHWSFERWEPLIIHPLWGQFCQPIYGFHLRHHAVMDCNESISGFFGLPLADWVFGTCVIPQTVYSAGEDWTPEKFRSPRPRCLIRALDAWASGAVRRRRALAVDQSIPRAANSDAIPPFAVMPRLQTRAEAIAGWVMHGIGLALSLAALSLLIVFSSLRGDAWHVVSFTVFGVTLVALSIASILRRSLTGEDSKVLFRSVENVAIFLLIAGTYTPFLLTDLRGPWGWSLFGVIWGLCAIGAVFQLLFGARHRLTSTLAFPFVGWFIVIALKPLLSDVPHGGLWLLLAGGVCYTTGPFLSLLRRLRFRDSIQHVCVLSGSACHVLAVLLFLLPRA